jgi:shikimate kinase
VILERTSKTRNRPLLQGDDPARKIRELLARRTPLYQSVAHMEVDTHGLEFGEIASGILESARYFFSRTESASQ